MDKFNKPKSIITNKRQLALKERLINKFWNNYDPDIIAPILNEMDKKETWVVAKEPIMSKPLNNIVELLKNTDLQDSSFTKNNNLEILITMLAYMNTSWAMRVLKWLDENRNHIFLKITVTCALNSQRSQDEIYLTPSQLYIDRLIAIKNLNILASIFDEKRVGTVSAFLNTFEEKQFESDDI